MTFIIDRFPGLHNRHDACDAVHRRGPAQDGGKPASKTGRQVVVADPYFEWDFEDKTYQKESPRRNEAATTYNNSVRL